MYWGKKASVRAELMLRMMWEPLTTGELFGPEKAYFCLEPPLWLSPQDERFSSLSLFCAVDLLPHVHLNFSIRELWIMTVFEMGELRRIQVFYSHLTQVRMPARGSNLKRKERKGGNEKESIFRNTNCKEDVISGYYSSCKSRLLSLVIFRKCTVIAPKSPPSIACQETLQITPPNFTRLQKEKKNLFSFLFPFLKVLT